ncbi:MAG: acyl carrier protein [Rhodospirillaceae bacterium]|nr:acyl carrier protein [Rhodospirillaceae bacterium]
MDDVQDKIFDIIAKERRLDRASLTRETRLDEVDIQSVDLVEIIFAIEDTFDVDIPQEEDAFKLETLGDIADGVRRLIAEKEQAAADA